MRVVLIGFGMTTSEAVQYEAEGKTVLLVSRALRHGEGIHLEVKPELVSHADLLATMKGTSNLLHTDFMGTVGVCSHRASNKRPTVCSQT